MAPGTRAAPCGAGASCSRRSAAWLAGAPWPPRALAWRAGNGRVDDNFTLRALRTTRSREFVNELVVPTGYILKPRWWTEDGGIDDNFTLRALRAKRSRELVNELVLPTLGVFGLKLPRQPVGPVAFRRHPTQVDPKPGGQGDSGRLPALNQNLPI